MTIERASDFLDALRREHVIAALDERAALMRQLLEQAATEAQGTLYADEFLLDECLMLIEKPFVVPGTIDPEFLELPEDVIISVMRDHQRYFAVHGADGRLLGRYLNVVGTAEEPKAIAKGNDRVLRARLKDAAFFVSEDRKVTLASRRSKLDAITFQHKLGSIGAKVERIRNIAAHVSSEVEPALLERAAMLCKADLESHIVFEFPELQGKMGRFYAAKDGEDERVCRAIEEHWRPAGAKDELPSEAIGASLAIADRIDTLAGCFAIGLVPKGNADPFALRRASVGLLRLAADGPVDVAFRSLIDVAFGELVRAGVIADSDIASARDQLLEFFGARARAFFRERGVATDLVEAAIGAWLCEPEGSLVRLEGRMRAVEALAASPAYDSLAVAFKRAFNIASSSTGSFEISKTESGAERALADAYLGIEEELHRLRAEGKFSEALSLIASRLRAPIDTFFEQVFVMAEDETIRQNRLALLGRIAGAVQSIIHFHVLAPRSTNATSE